MRAPREFVAAFLQGLFDTDGTADNRYGNVSVSTSSPKLARQIHMLLLNMGMVASLHVKQTKVNPSYRVDLKGEDAIQFHKQVGFRLLHKQQRSQLAAQSADPTRVAFLTWHPFSNKSRTGLWPTRTNQWH